MNDLLHDVRTMVWKEWTEFVRQRSTMVSIVFFITITGVLVPVQQGRSWVDSRSPPVYAVVFPIFLVLGIVADTFAGERERHTLETLLASRLSDHAILIGKFLAVVGYCWGLTAASLLTAAAVVNIKDGLDGFAFYPLRNVVASSLFSLLGAGLAAGAGVLISLRSSTVRQAAQVLSIGMLVISFIIIAVVSALPRGSRDWVSDRLRDLGPNGAILLVAGILLAVDAALLTVALIRFQRTRLILD